MIQFCQIHNYNLQSHKDWRRSTIFDTLESADINNLYYNARIIAEALARLMYGFSESNVLITHVRIVSDFNINVVLGLRVVIIE